MAELDALQKATREAREAIKDMKAERKYFDEARRNFREFMDGEIHRMHIQIAKIMHEVISDDLSRTAIETVLTQSVLKALKAAAETQGKETRKMMLKLLDDIDKPRAADALSSLILGYAMESEF